MSFDEQNIESDVVREYEQERQRLNARIAELEAQAEKDKITLRAAEDGLKQIADSPHQQYPTMGESEAGFQYAIGVSDGHRCAANTAKTALRKLREGTK